MAVILQVMVFKMHHEVFLKIPLMFSPEVCEAIWQRFVNKWWLLAKLLLSHLFFLLFFFYFLFV